MASSRFAIIAGAGAGTGAALARTFAKAYPVFLLARTPKSYDTTVQEINASGGKAFGISADLSSGSDIKRVFGEIEKQVGKDASCAVGLLFSKLHKQMLTDLGRPPFLMPVLDQCGSRLWK